ncbi:MULTISPECIES: hypothetical protein [Streptomyces]|nr:MULTISPECIES: hypothetical protein [unclassified Streptomyces]
MDYDVTDFAAVVLFVDYLHGVPSAALERRPRKQISSSSAPWT